MERAPKREDAPRAAESAEQRGREFGDGGRAAPLQMDAADVAMLMEEGLLCLDKEMRVAFLNPAAEDILGRRLQDVLGKPFAKAFPAAAGSEFERRFSLALEHGGTDAFDLWFGKTLRRNHYKVKIQSTKDGLAICFSVTTVLQRTVQALRESEEFNLTLLDALPDGVCYKDSRGRWLMANQTLLRILGFNGALWKAADDTELAERFPHNTEALLQSLQSDEEAWRSGELRRFVEVVKDPEGEERLFEIDKKPLFDDLGARKGLISIYRDVTEALRVEEAIRVREQRYRTLAENFPNGAVVLFDQDLRFVVADGSGLEALGLAKEKLAGRTVRECAPGAICDILQPRLQRVLQGERLVFELQSGDRVLEIRALPILDGSSGVSSGLFMTQDITERKAIELELGMARENLREQVFRRTQALRRAIMRLKQEIRRRRGVEKDLLRSERELALKNKIASVFLTATDQDNVYEGVLDLIREDMHCEFGYFGYMNEDGELCCPSMTRHVWRTCNVANKEPVFCVEKSCSLWARSIKESRTVWANEGLEVPEGHVPLRSALAVPLIQHDRVIGQIAVANAPDGFGEQDRLLLESVAEYVGAVLYARVMRQRQESKTRQAEERLTSQANFINALIDAATTPIFYKSIRGEYQGWNKSFEEYLGVSAQDLVGSTAVDIAPPELAAIYEASDRLLIESGGSTTYEAQLRSADGSLREVLFNKATYADATGKVQGVVGFITDITARKQTEQALLRAKEAAEEASRIKSEFLASMSHEFRTPLGAILGLSELLKLRSLDEEMADWVDSIEESARGLEKLLNDILDYASIEEGRMEMLSQPFETAAVLEGAARPHRAEAEAKGVRLFWTMDEDTPRILVGDSSMVIRVLDQLTANAVKFTRQGEIEVSARLVRTAGEQAEISFQVRDTGPGVAQEDIQRIFELFTQADAGAARRYGGTGLGLAIAKRLVGLMGGQLTVQSPPGQGSVFNFTALFGLVSDEEL
ncbi:MAG: two-component system, sensor histidine kinase and response regulator [Desulfovibrionales bacterium]|nr:two-component system, sensor histidine kinase and response regulator [Desulfovibrionales bacterium]